MLLKLTIQFFLYPGGMFGPDPLYRPPPHLVPGLPPPGEVCICLYLFHFGFVLLQDVFVNGTTSQLLLKSQHRALSNPSNSTSPKSAMFIYLTKNKNHVHCRWGGPEERLVSHKDLSRPRPKLTSTGRQPFLRAR